MVVAESATKLLMLPVVRQSVLLNASWVSALSKSFSCGCPGKLDNGWRTGVYSHEIFVDVFSIWRQDAVHIC
jgi:hypothetical protein